MALDVEQIYLLRSMDKTLKRIADALEKLVPPEVQVTQERVVWERQIAGLGLKPEDYAENERP